MVDKVKIEKVEPQVGKRFRLPQWGPIAWVDPIHVGDTKFFAVNNRGEEGSYDMEPETGAWEEVEIQPAIPKQYFNVYLEGIGMATMEEANDAARKGRLGVVMVHTDESDSSDHASFQRVRWEK